VAPKTLLAQWRKELEVCGLGGSATQEYGGTANERCDLLQQPVGAALSVVSVKTGSNLAVVC